MDDRSNSRWTSFRHIHDVVRRIDPSSGAWAAEIDEDVVQTRGLQRHRKKKPAAEASDPPPADRPPLGYPPHYTSDPGPYVGHPTWSSQPSTQQHQSQYSGDPYQPSFYRYPAQQDLTRPPQNSYGHSHQSSASPPPSSGTYGSFSYAPPPGSSGPNHHQGSQSSHNYTASPTSYGSQSNRLDFNFSNSTSQPYDHRHEGYGQNQNDANVMYGNPNPGPRPGRVASAPGLYGCQNGLPDNGSCPGCAYHDQYGYPRR